MMLKIAISQLLKTFPQEKVIKLLYELATEEGAEVFLVGGIVRDILLSRRAEDIDLLVSCQALRFAQMLAERLKGRLIELKEEKGTLRVVKRYKGTPIYIDISQASAGDICHALKKRDFTINAMGMRLTELMAEGEAELVDCFTGMKDLNEKFIKHIMPDSLKADPLRMLRAFRLSASLGFKLDDELIRLIKAKPELIRQSAGERVSAELCQILAQPNSFAIFEQMDECGLLWQIFPEISLFKEFKLKGRARMDLWHHSLQTLMMMEKVMSQLNKYFKTYKKNIEEHLGRELAYGRVRLPLLKLAALLHDLGKPETFREESDGKVHFIGHEKLGAEKARLIARRLRLSRREGDYICQLIHYHLRPHYLFNATPLTSRALYRFFRHLDEESLDCVLLYMADALSYYSEDDYAEVEQVEKFSSKLARTYFDEYLRQEKMPRLINGDEIMEAFNLKPGKLIGELLEKVAEAQALGEVSSKEEALQMAESLLR